MARKSFSQYGQDLFAETAMMARGLVPRDNDYKGTFVDVGCCWPAKGNNTFLFYSKGWRGLCVDPNPEMESLYAEERPEDAFVNCGVGDNDGTLTYYSYTNRQHNSFDPGRAEAKAKDLIGKQEIRIRGLSELIDENLRGRKIDFMSMDIEDFELPALRSLDLERHRPSFMCIESMSHMNKVFDQPVIQYVVERGYTLIGHTGHDAFFVDKTAKK